MDLSLDPQNAISGSHHYLVEQSIEKESILEPTGDHLVAVFVAYDQQSLDINKVGLKLALHIE